MKTLCPPTGPWTRILGPLTLALLLGFPLPAEEVRLDRRSTMAQVERALRAAQPGDRILLESGGIWRGSVKARVNGSPQEPVYLGAWGEGPAPVLTDLVDLVDWQPAGPRLWKATLPTTGSLRNPGPAMLLRDHKPLALAREPDQDDPWGGYLPMGKEVNRHGLVSGELASRFPGVNWTGAQAVVRSRRWILDRLELVQDPSATALGFKTPASYDPYPDFGWFIQNHPACLDREGEWCYDSKTREIRLFSTTPPKDGQYRYPSRLFIADLDESQWLTVEGLEFQGSTRLQLRLENCRNLTIRGCSFCNAGQDGVQGYDTQSVTLEGNRFSRIQNNALFLGKARQLRVRGNTIEDTALLAGMGQGGDGQYNGIQVEGRDILVEDNIVRRTGYIPIFFGGDQVTVQHNLVEDYSLVKDDCGGIYTWSDGQEPRQERIIRQNLIRRGLGQPEGQSWESQAVQGIYLDDRSDNVLVEGNIILDVGDSGIFLHNAHECQIVGNIVVGCPTALMVSHDSIAPDHPVQNVLISGNLFCTTAPGQLLARIDNSQDSIPPDLDFAGNRWHSPFASQTVWKSSEKGSGSRTLDLAEITAGPDPKGRTGTWQRPGLVVMGPVGTELIQDGAFAAGTGSWGWWANRDNGRVSWLADTEDAGTPPTVQGASPGPSANPRQALRLDFPRAASRLPGQEDAMMLVHSGDLPLQKGHWYRLRLRVRAAAGGARLWFLTRKAQDPWTQSSQEIRWTLGRGWQDLEHVFPSTMEEGQSRAEFIIRQDALTLSGSTTGPAVGSAASGPTAWIDLADVTLQEVQVQTESPGDWLGLAINCPLDPGAATLPPGPWLDSEGRQLKAVPSLGEWQAALVYRQQ